MIVTIDRAQLLKALAAVAGAVQRRGGTIPILSHLLVETLGEGDGSLRLAATDMDIEARMAVPAAVDAPGACAVPATLADIARRLPEGCQVRLELNPDSGQLTVKGGRARFTLATLPAADFPVFAAISAGAALTCRADALKDLLDRTRPAVCTEEARYYLNGVYLHRADTDAGPALRAVATDGHRLARVDLGLDAAPDELPAVIVPRQTVDLMRKALGAVEAAAAVTLHVGETRLQAEIGELVLASKLIDGTFPDYDRVIPEAGSHSAAIVIDRELLAAAIVRANAISDDKGSAVKLSLDGSLTISACSSDGNTAEEALDDAGDGAIAIGFSARYLAEALHALGGAQVRIEMSDPASPARLTTPGDDRSVMVVMPMRV